MMTITEALGALRENDQHLDKFKKQRWITNEEAGVLANLVQREQVECYYECGTANGFSACIVADTLYWTDPATCRVHTWDPHDRAKVWDLDRFKHLIPLIAYHQEKYNDSIKQVVPATRLGRALFFVDGEHDWRSSKNDISNTLHVVQPGDILVLHDIGGGYEGLKIRFEEFQKTHRAQYFDTDRGMGAVWL